MGGYIKILFISSDLHFFIFSFNNGIVKLDWWLLLWRN